MDEDPSAPMTSNRPLSTKKTKEPPKFVVCPGCSDIFDMKLHEGPPFATSCCCFCCSTDSDMAACPKCRTVYCVECLGGFCINNTANRDESLLLWVPTPPEQSHVETN